LRDVVSDDAEDADQRQRERHSREGVKQYGSRMRIRIGANCIMMEKAAVWASRRHAFTIGDHCLIGRNAHAAGAVSASLLAESQLCPVWMIAA
jgi:hypothetical protein